MLKLGEILRAPKASIKIGGWRTGKVPASAFPLKKAGKLPQSPAWQWRIVEFEAMKRQFVLLIRLNVEVEYYSSILAMRNDQLIQVICHHEFHSSHRSWHCHFVAGNVEETFPGVLRDYDRMRVFDAKPSESGKLDFNVQLEDALGIASARFRFDAPDETPVQALLL